MNTKPMSTDTLTHLILGPGAIGALTCAQFQPHGSVYVYPHRSNLTLASTLTTQNTTPLKWTLWREDNANINIIWVTCKAFQLDGSLPLLLQKFPQSCCILLCNGMGPQQALKAAFPKQVFIGSTTCGAFAPSFNSFQQTSYGETVIDVHAKQHYPLLNTCIPASGPLNPVFTENITQLLWQKLLINACINPITALLQVKNGHLLNKKYQAELIAISQEVLEIARWAGTHNQLTGLAAVNHVLRLSANNYSSMAIDVKRQRTTEIDHINGYLLSLAQQADISTPRLTFWYQQIKKRTPHNAQ